MSYRTGMNCVPVIPLEQAMRHLAPYTITDAYLPLVSHELKIENEHIGLIQGGLRRGKTSQLPVILGLHVQFQPVLIHS